MRWETDNSKSAIRRVIKSVQKTDEKWNHDNFFLNYGHVKEAIASLLQAPWTRLFLRCEAGRKVAGVPGELPPVRRVQRRPARRWYLYLTKWCNPRPFRPPKRSHGLPVLPLRPILLYPQTWPRRRPIRRWIS